MNITCYWIFFELLNSVSKFQFTCKLNLFILHDIFSENLGKNLVNLKIKDLKYTFKISDFKIFIITILLEYSVRKYKKLLRDKEQSIMTEILYPLYS